MLDVHCRFPEMSPSSVSIALPENVTKVFHSTTAPSSGAMMLTVEKSFTTVKIMDAEPVSPW